MKLLIPHDFSYRKYFPDGPLPYHATGEKLRDEIQCRNRTIEVLCPDDAKGTRTALAEAQALVGYSVQRAWLDQAPALRWIQAASAGIDHFFRSSDVTLADLAQRKIVLTKASGVSRIVIGEHVMAMLLALSRGVPRAVRQQDRHQWQIFSGIELHGKTLGIVGLGQIGERVAELARALGMHVLGTTRQAATDYRGAAHRVYGHEQVDEIWRQSDALVLACAVNDQTRGLVNAQTLSHMRHGVLLVNIARGALIVEPDLVAALHSGQVAGAALDTFGQPGTHGPLESLEALHADSPLWAMENVLIMPNNAASSENIFSYLAEIIVENHARLIAGHALKYRVGS